MNTRSITKIKNQIDDETSSKKQKCIEYYSIYDDDDFYEELKKIYKKCNIGDHVTYITKNQLGVKTYEVIKDKNKMSIKEIGDIYGLYDDPDYYT
jgi:L-rhamnose mutarotase